jgi:hypothetical protein
MNMPGFTAEASLSQTSEHYHAALEGAHASGSVYPAQLITLNKCVSCVPIAYKDGYYGDICVGTRCTNWCISPPRVVSNEFRCFPVPIPVPKFPPKPEPDPSLPFPRF